MSFIIEFEVGDCIHEVEFPGWPAELDPRFDDGFDDHQRDAVRLEYAERFIRDSINAKADAPVRVIDLRQPA